MPKLRRAKVRNRRQTAIYFEQDSGDLMDWRDEFILISQNYRYIPDPAFQPGNDVEVHERPAFEWVEFIFLEFIAKQNKIRL